MAYLKYNIGGIDFTKVSQPGATLGALISRNRYRFDENSNIINYSGYLINAIDINWNGAKLNDETYINSTGDLIKQLQIINESITNLQQGNINLGPIQEQINNISETLENKANKNEIPNSIYQLNGWNDFVLESSVSDIFEEFKTYQKSPYDVYVQIENDNGNYNVLSKEDWLETLKGQNGINGKSAYQIWLDANNYGTEEDFLNSIKGDKGDKGDMGPGINILGYYSSLSELYNATNDTINGIGDAYNVDGVIYVYNNLYDSSIDTIDNKWKSAGSIRGERGDTGKSAYEIYVDIQEALGNNPLSEEDWLNSFKGDKGDKGDTGKSAYEIYADIQIALGNEPLSENDWINSLGSESVQYSAGNGISIENHTISLNKDSIWQIIN